MKLPALSLCLLLLGSLPATAADQIQPGDGAVGSLAAGVPALPDTPFDAPEGTWTLVVIPDTQHEVAFFADVFERQTEWISANKDRHRIRLVVHEGDVTDDNSVRQWERAKKAMSRLTAGGVPFAITTGNHDLEMVDHKPVSHRTRLNDYFTAKDLGNPGAVGFLKEGNVENCWQEIEEGGRKTLVVSAEFAPREEVLLWARSVIAERKPDLTILVTHAYLHSDGSRYDFEIKGLQQSATPRGYPLPGANDGEDVWRKLVSQEPTLRLVLCGHAGGSGAAYMASTNTAGHICHQIMANYQSQVRPYKGFGGGGFLRLMQFRPDGTVRVRTYSPWYNLWLADFSQEFEVDLRK